MIYVLMYLGAIVLANLSIVWAQELFGYTDQVRLYITTFNAFAWIGLDLTARDRLHQRWIHVGLWWKMALLIATGSLITVFLNRDAGQIASASFVAFACAGITDTLVFHAMRKRSSRDRVFWSNALAAAVDSIVFPTLAFGDLNVSITVSLFIAKVVGGYLWFLILYRKRP